MYIYGISTNEKEANCILDIDHFKDINDTHGHFVGDQVLTLAAQKLKALFNPTDIIGRIGGDEFVIFIKDIKGREETDRLAQSICDRFSTPADKDPLPPVTCYMQHRHLNLPHRRQNL